MNRMRTSLFAIAYSCAIAACCVAQTTQSGPASGSPTAAPGTAAPAVDETHFSVKQRGPNQTTLEKVTWEQGRGGLWTPRVHRVVQMATGLNRQDPQTGAWVESVPRISILPDGSGAAATQAQTALSVPGDLYSGAGTVTGPDGTVMNFRPAMLAYSDGPRSALIAELKPGSTGLLLPSGESVLYTNVATDFRLDVLVSCKLSGVSSELLIREALPDPSEYGFTNADGTTSSNVRLQWRNEFFDTQDPTVTPLSRSTGEGQGEG